MKMIKRLTTIAAASSLAITPIFAQSSPVSIEDTVTVTATVSPADLDAVPAKLVVSTLYSNVTFNDNDGTPLSVGGGVGATLSRYVSDVVTLDYVAPYGPWDIRIYTTRSDELEGLVDSSKDDPAGATAAAIAATDTIPLKFTTAPLTGANAFDISDDADWAGEDAVFSFVIKKGWTQNDPTDTQSR